MLKSTKLIRRVIGSTTILMALALAASCDARELPNGVKAPANFEDAKIALRQFVYHDQNRSERGTIYCGCQWEWVGRSGGRIDLANCDYTIRSANQTHRAERVEYEHIVPASWMGSQLQCWQDGGRTNCRNDPVFNVLEADMHNLTPSVGEVNADRSNYRFGMLPDEPYKHGQCDFKVNFSDRAAEPRDSAKGMIARVHFYIYDRYNLSMSDQQEQLFMAWHAQFPVSSWEMERDRRIASVMGHNNPFVTGERIWTRNHQNSADGLVSWLPQSPSDNEATDKIIGNKNSNLYHLPVGCPGYSQVSERNRVYFESESDAIAAGYRKAGNCR